MQLHKGELAAQPPQREVYHSRLLKMLNPNEPVLGMERIRGKKGRQINRKDINSTGLQCVTRNSNDKLK